MPDIISAFVAAVMVGFAKATGQQMFHSLRSILGLQEAQIRLLTSVDRKVDALLKGPFHAGTRELSDALAENRGQDDRIHLLQDARKSFTLAISQDPEPLRCSLAALHLAIIWRILGTSDDVRGSLEEAHDHAVLAVINDMRQSKVKQTKARYDDLVSENIELLGGTYKSQTTIRIAAPYINGVAELCREWGTPSTLAPIFIGHERAPSFREGEGLYSPAYQEYANRRDMATYTYFLRRYGTPLLLTDSWPRDARDTLLADAVQRGEYLLWRDLDWWIAGSKSISSRGFPYWSRLRRIL